MPTGDACVIEPEITIGMVNEQSGPVAYAGIGPREGAEVAIDEINSSSFLGDGVSLSLRAADSGGEIERATSEITRMLNDNAIAAIIGPASSSSAAAVAPLVERSQVPTIFTQAGSEGVIIGDWTFRITPPTETYYELGLDWLADNGYKDVALIYNATFPTFAQLGQEHIPAMAAGLDIAIGSSQEVQSTTQDFTNQAQVIASQNPSAVVMLLTAAPSVTFLNQLRDAGYEGQVLATPSQAGGNVADGGPAVDGIVFPVVFSPAMENEEATHFVSIFDEKFGKLASTYNAEGYDAIWWIARAIKETGCSTREGIQEGLVAVGAQGFAGAAGPLTFEGNQDARVDGTMIEWSNGAEILAG